MYCVEEGRDSTGKDAGASQAGQPDGKCNREQTADGRSPFRREPAQARVKRCGKSAPASRATGMARQTPSGARPSVGMGIPPGKPQGDPTPGRPHRWMVTQAPGGAGQNPAYRWAHRHPPSHQHAQSPANHMHPPTTCTRSLPPPQYLRWRPVGVQAAGVQPGRRTTWPIRVRQVVAEATSASMARCSCVATTTGLNVWILVVRPYTTGSAGSST